MTSSPRKMRTNGQLFVGATLCGRPRIAHKMAKTVYRLGQIYFIMHAQRYVPSVYVFFILAVCVETSSASCAANREIYSLLALLFLLLPKKARYATTFLGALR